MRASTVDWIHHGNMPINSVDVQPRGFRILTGGNDNKVCIWNLLPIVSKKYQLKGMEFTAQEPGLNNQVAGKMRSKKSKLKSIFHKK